VRHVPSKVTLGQKKHSRTAWEIRESVVELEPDIPKLKLPLVFVGFLGIARTCTTWWNGPLPTQSCGWSAWVNQSQKATMRTDVENAHCLFSCLCMIITSLAKTVLMQSLSFIQVSAGEFLS
jgi:hypothetical protein